MGKIKIEFSKRAAKDYKKLPKDYKALIDLTLFKLSEGLPVDVKPIMGEKDIYRIRVGKYRILFTIIENVLLVVRIATRGDIYK